MSASESASKQKTRASKKAHPPKKKMFGRLVNEADDEDWGLAAPVAAVRAPAADATTAEAPAAAVHALKADVPEADVAASGSAAAGSLDAICGSCIRVKVSLSSRLRGLSLSCSTFSFCCGSLLTMSGVVLIDRLGLAHIVPGPSPDSLSPSVPLPSTPPLSPPSPPCSPSPPWLPSPPGMPPPPLPPMSPWPPSIPPRSPTLATARDALRQASRQFNSADGLAVRMMFSELDYDNELTGFDRLAQELSYEQREYASVSLLRQDLPIALATWEVHHPQDTSVVRLGIIVSPRTRGCAYYSDAGTASSFSRGPTSGGLKGYRICEDANASAYAQRQLEARASWCAGSEQWREAHEWTTYRLASQCCSVDWEWAHAAKRLLASHSNNCVRKMAITHNELLVKYALSDVLAVFYVSFKDEPASESRRACLASKRFHDAINAFVAATSGADGRHNASIWQCSLLQLRLPVKRSSRAVMRWSVADTSWMHDQNSTSPMAAAEC